MPDFKPKTPVQLAPPKDDPISLEELAKADGKNNGVTGCTQVLTHTPESDYLTVPMGFHLFTMDPSWLLGRVSVSILFPYGC